MASAHVTIQLTFKNAKAFRALRVAIQELESLSEDFPYRPEPERAVKALRYALKSMTIKQL